MSVIFTRAPLRISLGGGGTDLPSYYKRFGGYVVSAAIDKYVYMLTHTTFQQTYKMKYSEFEEVNLPRDIRHPILRTALTNFWDGEPLEIASVADVPAGTGLGSSGAYTVCLLKALAIAGKTEGAKEILAERACHIEIDLLGEPNGKQDPYVSAFGGISAYTFMKDGKVNVDPLNIAPDTLSKISENMLLFYVGSTRKANTFLGDQDSRTKADDPKMLDNLHRTKEMGYLSRELLEKGDLEGYAHLMHSHWENKRARSPGIASKKVDNLYRTARDKGAVGGKLVGAGGSGFLMVYSPDPEATRRGMHGVPEVRFGIDHEGCMGSENL